MSSEGNDLNQKRAQRALSALLKMSGTVAKALGALFEMFGGVAKAVEIVKGAKIVAPLHMHCHHGAHDAWPRA